MAEKLADAIPYQPGLSGIDLAGKLARRGQPDEIRDPRLLAAVVYRWVAGNIAYDVVSLNPTSRAPQDPDVVLRSKKAVCEGYACLGNFLLNQNQIEARIIHGLARTGDDAIGKSLTEDGDGHAWLAVKWDGKWHLMEPTWGAGSVGTGGFAAGFSWSWFDPDPAVSIYSHFPEQDEMQLLSPVVSKSRIESAALPRPSFFEAINIAPSPLIDGNLILNANNPILIWKLHPGYQIAADAKPVGAGKAQAAQVVALPSGQTELRFPGLLPGTYHLNVFAGTALAHSLSHCGSFLLRQEGVSKAVPAPITHRIYDDIGAKLREPLTGVLIAGGWQSFDLQAPPGLTFALRWEGETTLNYLSFHQGRYTGRLHLRAGHLKLWLEKNHTLESLAEFEVK